jgi:Holliday junction resolvase RusA-like endonuclease
MTEQRSRSNALEIFLPMPPSANRIWRSGRGRVYRAPEYTGWLETCGWELTGQRKPSMAGPVSIDIEVSSKWRGDVDNRIKPTLDCLVKYGVIDGDSKKTVRSVRAFWSDRLADGIMVKISGEA